MSETPFVLGMSFRTSPVELRERLAIDGKVLPDELSMLREVIYEGKRTRGGRATWFIQSARRLVDLAFREELDTLIAEAGNQLTALRVLSQPESGARAGEDFHATGRIDLDLLKALLPFDDFDFYVCGPTSFTQALYDGLRAMHIRDERIHAETFGPSSLKRTRDEQTSAVQQPPAATTSVPVQSAPAPSRDAITRSPISVQTPAVGTASRILALTP